MRREEIRYGEGKYKALVATRQFYSFDLSRSFKMKDIASGAESQSLQSKSLKQGVSLKNHL
jgi:hypothetical protein